jgi:hypothetical protein
MTFVEAKKRFERFAAELGNDATKEWQGEEN